ncbi:MAG TPA: PAS domain S-box protein [Acidimicrobiales bacterium]|nr:PAS domain S-box protein [Acidimicrobiales bacterium]
MDSLRSAERGRSRDAAADSGLLARLVSLLPKGGTLPYEVWRHRHRGVLILLWLQVLGLFLFATARGYTWNHSLFEAGVVALPALAAGVTIHRRRVSTVFASAGLMTASAVLVHLSGGAIEAHFHFFVMVGVVVLYQDWVPFLVAIAFVVLHHGIVGVLAPHDVYNHQGAWDHPWTWAGIHGFSILAMSVAGIATWKLNERSQSQLANLAAIVESSDDAIYGWTVDGMINSWNRRAVELYGYTHDEIIGQPVSVLILPVEALEAESRLDRTRRGERLEPFDAERVRKDGSVAEVSVTISAVRNSNGDVIGGATIARDVSERRRAEEALRISQERTRDALSLLAATLESTADGILVVDAEGAIESFNARFAEMWRLPGPLLESRDDTGALAFVLDQLRDPETFMARVSALYLEPEAESHDTLHLKDGRVFERSSKPQRVDGVVVGRVWSFHDVSDRRRLESELAKARDKALESSRLKSEFLATMSHEIRTPMNGIIGLTGLLLDTELTDSQRQYGDGVRASGEALLEIINDILDFSKIEAGKLELERVDFDLAQAMDDVTALVAESARAKGLTLAAYCHPGVPAMVRGDVGRLRQILLNLVSNAVKFTPSGEVVVRAGLRATRPDQFVVHLEVADTGIGIDAGTAERLFEPFSQADASTTRQYGGTGLGLAICRRLAKAMGGTIGVDSRLGKGSTFWLDLPLSAADTPAPYEVTRPTDSPNRSPSGDPPRPAPAVGSQGRLLIAEDNVINQAVARGMAARLGYDCDVAANGIEALDALERQPYDAVLMDCQMPEMDGFEATAEIRRREEGTEPIPIIAMTASALVEDRERCLAAGMDDYLAKPVKSPELDRVLSKWRPAGRSEREGVVLGQSQAPVDDRVDEDLLAELLEMLADPSSSEVPAILELFLNETSKRLEGIQAAVGSGDLPEASRLAHSLKGSAGSFGARRLSSIGGEIEAACGRADTDAVSTQLPALRSEFDAFRGILLARFRSGRVAS